MNKFIFVCLFLLVILLKVNGDQGYGGGSYGMKPKSGQSQILLTVGIEKEEEPVYGGGYNQGYAPQRQYQQQSSYGSQGSGSCPCAY